MSKGIVSRIRPNRSITAEIPPWATRIRGRRCSIARNEPKAICHRLTSGPSNQLSLARLTIAACDPGRGIRASFPVLFRVEIRNRFKREDGGPNPPYYVDKVFGGFAFPGETVSEEVATLGTTVIYEVEVEVGSPYPGIGRGGRPEPQPAPINVYFRTLAPVE